MEAFTISVHAEFAGGLTTRLGDMVKLDEDQVRVEPNGSYPQVGVKSFGAGLFAKVPVSGSDTAYKAFNRLYDGALVGTQPSERMGGGCCHLPSRSRRLVRFAGVPHLSMH